MMKKIYLFGLLLILMSGIVSAISMPHPVLGVITSDGFAVKDLSITVNNLKLGTSTLTTTNDLGQYQIDLGNVQPPYYDGNEIKVCLTHCEDQAICCKSQILEGAYTRISFDIANNIPDTPIIPDTATIVKYVCSDNTIVSSQSDCPIPQIECADGTFVEDETDCPEKSNSWIAWVIGILVVLFGAGGWKIYNGKFKHYHRGIKSYHDPNTQHTNIKYRHRAFKKDPIGCINDVAKIQKGIDLSQ